MRMENYARFYSALNRMPYSGDREELKEQIVKQFTFGRTVHLREMTSLPTWECGLKRLAGLALPADPEVTPHVGVWIETP